MIIFFSLLAAILTPIVFVWALINMLGKFWAQEPFIPKFLSISIFSLAGMITLILFTRQLYIIAVETISFILSAIAMERIILSKKIDVKNTARKTGFFSGILTIIIIASMAITLHIDGFKLAVVIWNIFPVIIFYLILWNSIKHWKHANIAAKISLILLSLTLVGFPVFMCLGHFFNYPGMRHHSSGLTFYFLPVLTFIYSIIPFIVYLISKTRWNKV